MTVSSINRLGWMALITLILGSVTSSFGIGIIISIISLIITTMLYKRIDDMGYGTSLFNFSISQYLIAGVPTGLMVYFGVSQYTDKSHGVMFLVAIVILALLLFVAILNYFIAKSLLIVAEKCDNAWFKISGILTKFGAYTVPVLIGFMLLILAQPIFLIGCITFKGIQKTA
ncbi:DUF996 domain-containing protein [Aquella oligotrophica]|uniref:DUF996 domain-containing protein n=1 Tax=Aquella oligotrophica TaxID=2067065 RepID=A0A2I7N8B8_9NEIS|nr:DUF996 domain-containing protein [Aquella oligotrophica]AUR52680.1 hypothetical protein CUN60_10355 [Aquella oligotrophica]